MTAEEKTTLEEGFRNHEKHHFQIRCKTVLLSDEGFPVPEIARFFKIRTRTICDWFNRFESIGIVGLMILSGRGRKAVLDACDDDEIITIKEIVRWHPQSIRKICEKLNGMIDFPIKITKNMLRRFLKKCLRYSWKRLRKALEKFPDPDEYDQKVKELAELFCLEEEGFLNIYFADESSFSLTPSVPYGWQKIGETDGIPSERSSKTSKQHNFFVPTLQRGNAFSGQFVLLEPIPEHIVHAGLPILSGSPKRGDNGFIKSEGDRNFPSSVLRAADTRRDAWMLYFHRLHCRKQRAVQGRRIHGIPI